MKIYTFKKQNKKNGFVILFSVTLAAILLSIALGVATISEKEIKFGTSAKDTNNAFTAADTGVECALLYDKSGTESNAFTGSASMNCAGANITPVQSPADFWTFVLTGIGGSGESCARVTVDKTRIPTTRIVSKGYNVGRGSCDSNNPARVEREIEVSYSSGFIGRFNVDTGKTLVSGLTAYWKLDEASGIREASFGGATLADNNGTGQAGGKVNYAASFIPASSQFLSNSSSLAQVGDESFTFAGWYYFNSTVDTVLLAKDSGPAGEREYDLRLSGNLHFDVYRPTNSQVSVASGVPISPGNWYFVVVWHDAPADTIGISVNGVESTAPTGGALQSSTNAALFTVGARQYPGSQNYFDGRIDELGFWKRVLTATEKADLYNEGIGNTYNP